jgi:hypothetical protein
VVTVLAGLSAAELLAVVRACGPLHLGVHMGDYFRGFLARLLGAESAAATAKAGALTDDELRAVYATVRHLRSLSN